MTSSWNQEEDLAIPHADEEAHPLADAPVREPRSPGEWIKENLFSTPWNGVLTIVTVLLSGYLAYGILRWVFFTAEWTVVKVNFRLFMVGRFPIDQVYRVWICLCYVTVLVGLSWGWSGRRLVWDAKRFWVRGILAGMTVALLLWLVESALARGLTAGTVVVFLLGIVAGRRRPRSRGLRRVVVVGWLVAFPFVILVLLAFGGVSPLRWGGFLLNVLIAVVGIVLSFPIGILLALGRRSSFPAIRVVCVGFIEVMRGGPLYVWLLFGQFLLPFLLPPGLPLPPLVRAMIMFTLFSSAYVAEIVRGGLQGVHHSQFEAARALGLSVPRMTALVILPQALRNTIPAMISHFISLFKDTSLLAIIGFIETLRVGRIASAAAKFVGTSKQTLLFAALIFWVVAFSMSRWSQRLEKRLGVGER